MAFTIFLAPLIGALICGFGWRMIGEVAAAWTGTALLALASVLSWVAFLSLGDGTPVQVMRWIESGSLTADWALRVDLLAAVMLVVATSMGLLVSMFALGDPTQAEQEGQRARLVGFIALFVFSVVALVTADNLVQLLFGWEVMTVAAYLLIGYRNGRAGSNAAAVKAFVVNRAGDIGLWLGVAVTFLLVDSVAFDDIFATLPELVGVEVPFLGEVPNSVGLMAALFLIGALAKSAQLPLHVWLPD
ncbi:MAG: proton-conducting transporter membrane subunit, partial [Pseudomonadota bacterium]